MYPCNIHNPDAHHFLLMFIYLTFSVRPTHCHQNRFYPARYHKFYNSIFALGDICDLIPDESCDVCILEEPEHLNWYRAPGKLYVLFELRRFCSAILNSFSRVSPPCHGDDRKALSPGVANSATVLGSSTRITRRTLVTTHQQASSPPRSSRA